MKQLVTIAIIALAASVTAQDMPLSQVLIPGEKWELVVEGLGFTDAPTADDKGNFYYSDMRSEQGLFRVSSDGKVSPFLKGAVGISGMKFGPDGKLYACRARARELVSIDLKTSEMTVLAKGVRPNDLVVTHKGYLYFTETLKKQVTFVNTKTGATKVADVGITGPNGICLSPDQGTLAVSDFRGKHCWVFRVESDGSLKYKQPYMTMRRKPDPRCNEPRRDSIILRNQNHFSLSTLACPITWPDREPPMLSRLTAAQSMPVALTHGGAYTVQGE